MTLNRRNFLAMAGVVAVAGIVGGSGGRSLEDEGAFVCRGMSAREGVDPAVARTAARDGDWRTP